MATVDGHRNCYMLHTALQHANTQFETFIIQVDDMAMLYEWNRLMEFLTKCSVVISALITTVNHTIKQVRVILANQLLTHCLVL